MATVAFERINDSNVKVTIDDVVRIVPTAMVPNGRGTTVYFEGIHTSLFNFSIAAADTITDDNGSVSGTADEIAEDLAVSTFFKSAGSSPADDVAMTTEYTTTQPDAPATGVTLYAQKTVKQTLIAQKGIEGDGFALQPFTGERLSFNLGPQVGTTSWNGWGITTPTVVGTSTLRALASTNFQTQVPRMTTQSSGSAGSTAGYRYGFANGQHLWRGNAAGRGGFYFVMKFGISQEAANYIFFAGLTVATSAPGATTEASALTNTLGVGKDSTDTTLQFMHNDGSGTATKTNTGFTPSTSTMYALVIRCKPNDTVVHIGIMDMSIGRSSLVELLSISTKIPSNTTFLSYMLHISNNATASPVSVELAQVYGHYNF